MFTPIMFGYNLLELSEFTVTVRVVLSMICSAFLGFERVRKRRAAGVRTYVLVCVASALIMMTSQFVSTFAPNTDLTRLGAQVISGIGFLGAGTIMLTGQHRVKGLTTAAGLWTAACIGIAIGSGFYFGGVLLCVVVFLTMTAMGASKIRFMQHLSRIQIYMVMDESANLGDFINYIRQHNMVLIEVEALEPNALKGVGVSCTLKSNSKMDHLSMLDIVNSFCGVQYAEEV